MTIPTNSTQSKLQELYLKISFTLANASSSSGPTRLPDVLGIIARAKGSNEAVTATKEISQIGHFVCDSDSARHHEKGIIAYAQKSVEFDMDFLEAVREEACAGMDAFDTVMELEAQSETQRITACAAFLMQVLERMANRLEGFYAKLARHSVFQPEMERNPARARWNILKRKIRDGSFFILARQATMTNMPTFNNHRAQQGIDFDHVINHIQNSLNSTTTSSSARNMSLTEQHAIRAQNTSSGTSAYEHHQNGTALKAMNQFMDTNKRAIRRLSRLPQELNMEQLMQAYGTIPQHSGGLPTPPSSRSSSRSPSVSNRVPITLGRRNTVTDAHPTPGLQRRNTGASDSSLSSQPAQISPAAALQSLMTKMNTRPKTNAGLPSPPQSATEMADRVRSMQALHSPKIGMGGEAGHARTRSTTGSLRSFRLQASALAGGMTKRSETRV
jgi:hypothetical protein